MCGQLRHATAATGGTESAFATERDHHLVPAPLTPRVQAAVAEDTAPEVGLELAPDEGRQPPCPVLPGRPREEGGKVRRDGPVEHGLLGLAALVRRTSPAARTHGPAGEHGPCLDAATP